MNAITTITMDHNDVARALATGNLPSPVATEAKPAPVETPEPIMQPAAPGMAVTTTVKDLRAALMACGKVVASSSYVPILECVRIDAASHFGSDYVSVSGTDMDVAVTVTLQSEVYTAGAVILPLKPLKKTLVKRKAGEPVSIEAIPADSPDGSPSARITVGETEFRMSSYSTDEWPAPAPAIEPEVADIPGAALAGAIADVAAAQSTEETRYYLNGVLFERTDKAFLRTAATDGHRLHVHDTGWHWPAMGVQRTDAKTGETDREPRAIVPRLAITALQHLLKGATIDRDILVSSDGHRMEFEADGWRLATKLIDGSYPDFDRVIGAAFPTVAGEEAPTVHHAELENGPTLDTMRAIKAAATDPSHAARLDFSAGEIRGGSVDSGNHSRHPLARVNGECGIGVIGLNAAYLADVAERFADVESASLTLTMTDPGSPIGVTSGCKPYFTAVVMPLRI